MTNLIKIVCWEVWALKASFTLPLFIEVSTKPGALKASFTLLKASFTLPLFIKVSTKPGALKASFTLPLFIEVPVPNQESQQSYICALDFLIVWTAWYFMFFLVY